MVAELRRAIDEVCAAYGKLVTTKHRFDASERYVPDSEDWPADHGWTTELWPAVQGTPVQVYFDGVDQDLQVRVGEYPHWVGWFEWSTDELDDNGKAVTEVAGLVSGVLAGDIWTWPTRGHRPGCEVLTPGGCDGAPAMAMLPQDGGRDGGCSLHRESDSPATEQAGQSLSGPLKDRGQLQRRIRTWRDVLDADVSRKTKRGDQADEPLQHES